MSTGQIYVHPLGQHRDTCIYTYVLRSIIWVRACVIEWDSRLTCGQSHDRFKDRLETWEWALPMPLTITDLCLTCSECTEMVIHRQPFTPPSLTISSEEERWKDWSHWSPAYSRLFPAILRHFGQHTDLDRFSIRLWVYWRISSTPPWPGTEWTYEEKWNHCFPAMRIWIHVCWSQSTSSSSL